MQIKVFVPREIEIPNEYVVPLVQRAMESLGDAGKTTLATRGHLVRQAVMDGLLRDLDHLIRPEGNIELYCDPQGEIALEIDNHAVTLSELLVALQNKTSLASPKRNDFEAIAGEKVVPRRRAA